MTTMFYSSLYPYISFRAVLTYVFQYGGQCELKRKLKLKLYDVVLT